jgi:pimeloyl-ACP methyl ester carboxylesterase
MRGRRRGCAAGWPPTSSRWTVLREQPWQFPLVIAQWLRIGPRTMIALWRSAAPDRIEQRLPAVSVPVTVVRGSRDAICPADWARCLAEVVPCGRLVEVPGAAHMTVQTHPAAVAAVLAAATRR